MSLGIKSFATEGVGTKNFAGEFRMGSWIYDGCLDSRWVPGFTMGALKKKNNNNNKFVASGSLSEPLVTPNGYTNQNMTQSLFKSLPPELVKF